MKYGNGPQVIIRLHIMFFSRSRGENYGTVKAKHSQATL